MTDLDSRTSDCDQHTVTCDQCWTAWSEIFKIPDVRTRCCQLGKKLFDQQAPDWYWEEGLDPANS